MASKPKKIKTPETKEFPGKNVQLAVNKGDSEVVAARKRAALVISPELAACRVINGAEKKSGIGEDIDVPLLMEQLRDSAVVVNRGDLTQAEAMLMNQATALQSLFARLAERGMGCDSAPAFEVNMRMALRAQNQCRATLETLAAIKNPPIVYAKQANFANGPQQVNNGVPASPPPTHARGEKTIQSNELLKDNSHETEIIGMDTGTTRSAGGADPQVETVGALDRAKHG